MATSLVNRVLTLLLLVQGIISQTSTTQQSTESIKESSKVNETVTEVVAVPEFKPNDESIRNTGYSIGNSTETEEPDYGIRYYLYTRGHPISYVMLGDNAMLKNTDFNTSRPTVIVIHGFTGSGDTTSVTVIKDAFLFREDMNVISVHWQRLAKGPDYEVAANNTELVARHLAKTIEHLVTEEGVRLETLHLVGFSLGAQVAGLTGGLLTIGKLPRITALDPAGPMFHNRSNAWRLDSSDADFVLVLHTSGGFVSFNEPLGHADFYPNAGKSPQPACMDQVVKLVCSHLIAPLYFTESIYNETAFAATRCDSWLEFTEGLCDDSDSVYMGPHTPPSTRGLFFLHTNPTEPYGKGAPAEKLKDNIIDGGMSSREGRTVEVEDGGNDVDVREAKAMAASGPQTLNLVVLATCVIFSRAWLPGCLDNLYIHFRIR